ncbi:nSTAND1 domain-containing NTPase [Streptomyces sulfonofaciens]|nr:WD40 repeat domain-containing protein [Streptomyces sulfonofaciens]
MGRRELPLDPNAGPVARFAGELRALRQRAGGPTYRQMSERAGYSVSALSQAAAGSQLPSLAVALAYVRACGGLESEWEPRWREAAEEVAARPRDADAAGSPYRGLARFEVDDAALFFGRDRLVDQVAGLARRRRFAAVFGPSGSGKSSLLRAGLIPRLRGTDDPALRPAAVRVLTPGDRPMRTHGERLSARPGGEGDTWLVVDQFEELYTLCRDPGERVAFVDRLLAAVEPGSRLRVVVAVRADFLGHCTEHAGLTAVLQDATVLTGQMSGDELREAVVRPAAAAGLIVERSLTARIVAEVEGEPGALPLMSHALLETWRRRRGRALTEAAYEAAGGLHGAIARTAEGVYGRFSPAQADVARRVLLRLVTPGDGTPDTRRPADRGELGLTEAGGGAAVLEALVAARLLVTDEDTVDLAHEALITAWPRLRGWIDAERDRLRVHRQLSEATRSWLQLDRDPGVLYRGSRLTAAEDAFPASGRDRDLTGPERAFLSASAQQRRRGVLLRRSVTALVAALALIASGTAVVALQQRATARAERNTAVFNQVATEADQLRGSQSSLAARLDLAAYRMRATAKLKTRLTTDAGAVLSTALAGPKDIVTSVAFSPDGRTLAATGYDRRLRLWNVARPGRPRLLRELPTGHTDFVDAVAFSPDGRVLATAGEDHTVRLWDVRDPARPRHLGAPLTGHTDYVETVAFSPDGRTLASAGGDRTVRLWDVTDPGRPRRLGNPLRGHTDFVTTVAFSPDGRTLASSADDHTVRLWDVSSPAHARRLGTPLTGHTAAVWSVAFSTDGRTMATGGFDEAVRLWDVHDPARPRQLGEPLTSHTAPVWSVVFSPDGHTLASGGADDTVRLWNVENPAYPLPLGGPLTDHTNGVWSVAFNRDGRTLASAGYDRTVRVWHLPDTLLTGYTNPVNAVAFAPHGRVLATASSDDHLVRLWDVAGPGRPVLAARLTGPTGAVTSVAFSPDGHTLAAGSADRTVLLWDVRDPARPRRLGAPLTGHGDAVDAVAFSPDGRTLASASEDNTARLWDVRDPARPAPAGVLRGHGDAVTSVAFSPDGHTLATASEDNTARLWNVAQPRRAAPLGAPLDGAIDRVMSVAFSPDGATLAAGSADRTVRLWDVRDPARPALRRTLTGHTDAVTSVAFSPDGHTLASGGSDQTVRLWDVRDPARAAAWGQPLTGHVDTVTSVAFSADGRTLASGSYDVTVRLWPLDMDRVIRQVCDGTGGALVPRQWERYVPQLPYRSPCA